MYIAANRSKLKGNTIYSETEVPVNLENPGEYHHTTIRNLRVKNTDHFTRFPFTYPFNVYMENI